jgi:diaminohydroxyphosphoribosylaminopyrimidine deaminase/5-amino-6-(5-phosphoribosylamino)uracil reductase
VDVGLFDREARELNAPFFHAVESDRPWTTLKLAVSIETAIATADRRATWLTGGAARELVHRMRAGSDAIAVGVGTVLADDPRLTVREWREPRVAPTRVVFDRALRTPVTAAVVRSAREVPTIIVADPDSAKNSAAFRALGVHVIGARSLSDALRGLRARGIRSLLMEGGARVSVAALEEGVVQRMTIFQAPVALGARALPAFAGASRKVVRQLETMPVIERRSVGPDVMTTYALAES